MRSLVAMAVLTLASYAVAEEPAAAPKEPAVLKSEAVRLLQPESDLETRIDGARPLADYIRRVEAAADAFFRESGPPKAKGVLVVIGVKPNGQARAWCEAVEGEIPRETLDKLEAKLAEVKPLKVKSGPIAFGTELHVVGERPGEFPAFPAVWTKAAPNAGKPLRVPDDLFPLIWPD